MPVAQQDSHVPEYPITTRAALRAALTAPRTPRRQQLGALLVQAGCLHDTGVRRALAAQRVNPGARLGEQLLSARNVAEECLYQALSDQLGVPYVRLGEFDVEATALDAVPLELARSRRVLPLMLCDGKLIVATDDPADRDKMSVLQFCVQQPVEAVLASPRDLDTAIATHYPGVGDAALEYEADRLLHQHPEPEVPAIQRLALERPIVRLVDNILLNAVQRRASDIHLRSREHAGHACYRIDGSLAPVGDLHKALMPGIIARIKVLAGMDLAEHRLPQDGAIRYKAPHGTVDMRVSIMPAVYGENVVVRILDPSVGLRRLADVGFSPQDERRFRSLIDRNQGLVLVTGPTGCGKTTTLYAALQELNDGQYHIVTVEDPVEYRLDGVVQMQVHEDIGFGFAQALRHILRHDPDIILVGEIRDSATAKLAVESALTGHLVLSTLHTNSAAQTITRLIEIGVAPFLVNATLAGVLAQRLVRRNCEHCKTLDTSTPDIRAALGVGTDERFWRGSGCGECSGTGFHGRVAVYEILEMSPEIRRLVSASAGHDQIEARAVQEGMVGLTVQALSLARAGVISLAEVFRARLD
jgi:type IV pilus assembly protein PilB